MSYKYNQKAPALPKNKPLRDNTPFAGKKLVQVEKGTCVYVPSNATRNEIQTIINQVRENLDRHKLPLKGVIK